MPSTTPNSAICTRSAITSPVCIPITVSPTARPWPGWATAQNDRSSPPSGGDLYFISGRNARCSVRLAEKSGPDCQKNAAWPDTQKSRIDVHVFSFCAPWGPRTYQTPLGEDAPHDLICQNRGLTVVEASTRKALPPL